MSHEPTPPSAPPGRPARAAPPRRLRDRDHRIARPASGPVGARHRRRAARPSARPRPAPAPSPSGAARAVLANPSYNERKARGCVPYSLAQVWQALQIPTGVDVAFWPERTETDCEAWLVAEPGYAVSFVTKEIPHGGIQSHYTFDVTWRADVTQGTAAAPTEVKMLYGKTAGTVEVPKILGSMVFTADAAPPGLDADRPGPPAQHERPLRRAGEAPRTGSRASTTGCRPSSPSARSRPATASFRRGSKRRARPGGRARVHFQSRTRISSPWPACWPAGPTSSSRPGWRSRRSS